jgi:DNA polymerase V
LNEEEAKKVTPVEQLDIFSMFEQKSIEKDDGNIEKERKMQLALLDIKGKYGKNAIMKCMSLEEGATAIDRNGQIGGHRA